VHSSGHPVLGNCWVGRLTSLPPTPPPAPAGLKAFFTTPQLSPGDKLANALALGTSPVVRSLIDPEGGMQVRSARLLAVCACVGGQMLAPRAP